MSGDKRRCPGWIGLLVAVCMAGSPVAAQSAPADYDALVTEAVLEFNRGNFTEARALFEQAHRIDASARTLRGLGVCAYELRHYAQAIDLFEHALLEPHKALSEEQRADVTNQLAKARRFVGVVTLELVPADARVQIDGETTSGRRLTLDAGEHGLEISAPGYRDHVSRFNVTGGQQLAVMRHLTAIDVSPTKAAQAADEHVQVASTAQAPTDAASGSVLSRWWFWTIVGGVVIAGVAVGVGVVASRAGANTPASGTTGAVLRAP